MNEISRQTGIKIICIEGKKQGLSIEDLRDMCPGGSISRLTAVEMHDVIKKLGKHYFVKEPGAVLEIRRRARMTGVDVMAFISKRFSKDSLYKLSSGQVRSVLGMLRNYAKA